MKPSLTRAVSRNFLSIKKQPSLTESRNNVIIKA